MTLRAYSISIAPGSEPEPKEIDDIDQIIDDAIEAIGAEDQSFFFMGEFETCVKSPRGQCEYLMADNFMCCVHCGRESGL